MRIVAVRLSSGYVRISGEGPCNWSQPPFWPCHESVLRTYAFPEASEEFIRAAMDVAHSERKVRTA